MWWKIVLDIVFAVGAVIFAIGGTFAAGESSRGVMEPWAAGLLIAAVLCVIAAIGVWYI